MWSRQLRSTILSAPKGIVHTVSLCAALLQASASSPASAAMSTQQSAAAGAGSAAASSGSSVAVAAAAASASVSATASASSSGGMFQLTPLYGPESSHSGALCSVLRLDDFVILLDCGWDERYSESHLASLRAIMPSVDLVLITHPDIYHLGALPYVVGTLGYEGPIYATLPVWRMGQMFLYSSWQERWGHLAPGDLDQASSGEEKGKQSKAPVFTLDDVDHCFSLMRQLKYSQTVRLTDKGEGIEITPSNAGHMLGGAFWHIQKGAESIIYAVDTNHAGERHLNGTLLNAPQFHRPSALITDATNALVAVPRRKEQDKALCDAVTSRLRAHGNVLIPSDAAGRSLEILLVLNGFWAPLANSYDLFFLSPQSHNTVDFARSQLEWMTDKARKQFDTSKVNPFALGHVKLVRSWAELQERRRQAQGEKRFKPFCVLASSASLETSPAQDAFVELAPQTEARDAHDSVVPARNLLLLTSRAPAWSVAGQLFDPVQPHVLRSPLPPFVDVQRRRREELQGAELKRYHEEQRIQATQKRLEADRDNADLDDDADEDMLTGGAGKLEGAARRAAAAAAQIYPLFPYAEPKRSYDVWGEVLTADELRMISGKAAPAPLPLPVPVAAASKGRGGGAASTASNMDLSDSNATAAAAVVPHRSVLHTVRIALNCAVQFLDFEGRSDGKSQKTVIKDVQPRKLIILSGSADAKQNLRDHCVNNKICDDVVIPTSNQSVLVTTESSQFQVHLKESFLQSLRFVPLRDGEREVEVAWAEGELALLYAHGANLPLLSAPSRPATGGHPAVFLGHFTLAQLREQLNAGGVAAEIVGGVVVCAAGAVNVRKVSPTQISVQGALCEEYFRIRDILYEQYEIV